MKFATEEGITKCRTERENGKKVGTTTKLKTLPQEKHGTPNHPLILMVKDTGNIGIFRNCTFEGNVSSVQGAEYQLYNETLERVS